MRRIDVALALVAVSLVACNSSTITLPQPPPPPVVPSHLYVATETANLLVYTLPISSSSTPVVTLGGFTDTEAVALDGRRHIYVVDNGVSPAVISEFNLPLTSTSTPIATIHTPAGTNARALAIDTSNNVWVPSLSSNIYEFVGPFSGSVTPAPTITLTSGLSGPEGLAFDQTGTLYAVNNGGTTVAVFYGPQVNAQTVSETLDGIAGDSRGVAIDNHNSVYVLEDAGNIDFFTIGFDILPYPNGTTPSFSNPRANTGITFGGGLAIDASGNLYGCDFTTGLYVFANAAGSFSSTTTPSVHLPGGCSNIATGF